MDDPFCRPPTLEAIRNGLLVGLAALDGIAYGGPWLLSLFT